MFIDAPHLGATQQAACPLMVVLEMRRLVLARQFMHRRPTFSRAL